LNRDARLLKYGQQARVDVRNGHKTLAGYGGTTLMVLTTGVEEEQKNVNAKNAITSFCIAARLVNRVMGDIAQSLVRIVLTNPNAIGVGQTTLISKVGTSTKKATVRFGLTVSSVLSIVLLWRKNWVEDYCQLRLFTIKMALEIKQYRQLGVMVNCSS
jgi:hypothetical protein